MRAVPASCTTGARREWRGLGNSTHRVAAKLPQHFEAVFTNAEMPEAAEVQAALQGHHRGLQAALILNQPQQVVDRLVAWVLPVTRPTSCVNPASSLPLDILTTPVALSSSVLEPTAQLAASVIGHADCCRESQSDADACT